MIALALAVSLVAPGIDRDAYGVAHITAGTPAEAFRLAGYAVAEDRLWQIENARRLSRGRLAEVLGRSFLNSDREVRMNGYTDAELDAQVAALGETTRQAFVSYAEGVNQYIEKAKREKALPAGYAENGFEPEPWTTTDSAAIAIRMFQLFGRGGAGEIRNLALIGYLQAQPNAKDKALDIMDDFGWQNDPAAIPTIAPEDDRQRAKAEFVAPTRADTERQLAAMPKAGLLELLPGIRLASRDTEREAAEVLGSVSKVGSYAVVVSPKRSLTKNALLLGAPQMGFQSPSVVHEISIDAPGLQVAGMGVPGVPGIAVGMTPNFAWTLTSGVADTDDIFVTPMLENNAYMDGKEPKTLEVTKHSIKVKGEPDVEVTSKRTRYGPVVVTAGRAYFSRRMGMGGVELKSAEAMLNVAMSSTPAEIEAAVSTATANFNFFYATAKGDIGYRYVGRIPVRAAGLDPRLPTPADAENDWRGYIPADQLPHVRNPKSGLIANWNNKPAAWWPNLDTPVWGRIFRNESLLKQLQAPGLTVGDLERAATKIAQHETTYDHFKKYLPKRQGLAAAELTTFGGENVSGSVGASIYKAFIDALRETLFMETTGNFIAPDNFRMIAQPSVMLNALERETKVNYLGARKPKEVAEIAYQKALDALTAKHGDGLGKWGYTAPSIRWKGADPVPYSDRGTYIQIIELGAKPAGRNVAPPGTSEAGQHALDQVPLVRTWGYKPMRGWRS